MKAACVAQEGQSTTPISNAEAEAGRQAEGDALAKVIDAKMRFMARRLKGRVRLNLSERVAPEIKLADYR